mmetsp:Transcript_40642/g.122351  ORF Transcript_40642/g.122351 Transcript_40642/m.122351 type:complete len:99 (-) Transcript_40642:2024-2320(-)
MLPGVSLPIQAVSRKTERRGMAALNFFYFASKQQSCTFFSKHGRNKPNIMLSFQGKVPICSQKSVVDTIVSFLCISIAQIIKEMLQVVLACLRNLYSH